jgi:hypothetical protein
MIAALALFLFTPVARAQWTTAKRITWTPGYSNDPVIAVGSGSTLHVVWRDSTPGDDQVYYKRSTDGGTTWGAAKRLAWTSGNSNNPAIAVDGNNHVHVVWDDNQFDNTELCYKRSTDGGTTWSTLQRLTWTSGNSANAALAIQATATVHLVWQDYTPGAFEIYYKKSTNGGTTWGTAERITWTSGGSYRPGVVIDSTNEIHAVWSADAPIYNEIFHKKSADGGATWGTAKRITWTSGTSDYPSPAIDSSDGLHVVWQDDTPGSREIYYKRTTDGGTTWSTSQRLTWTSGYSNSPIIAIDSNNHIHAVWYDYTPGDPEIYYKKSTDTGTTWSAAQRLTWTSGNSSSPTMDIDSSDTMHLVWVIYALGSTEIYYKQGK